MTDFSGMKLAELTTAYNEMVLTAIDLGIKAKTIKLFKDRPTGLKRCQQLDAEISKLNGKSPTAPKKGRRTGIADDTKISILVSENPKRSTAAERFAFYKEGMLVSTYVNKVGNRTLAYADLRWDSKQKFIKLIPATA
jgi:hypothetical protein